MARQSSNGQTCLPTRTARCVPVLAFATRKLAHWFIQNYLGHSINAPTGRWQKNKDIHWYNRDLHGTQAERDEEIRKIKEAEAEAMSVALCVSVAFHVVTAYANLESSEDLVLPHLAQLRPQLARRQAQTQSLVP